MSRRVEVIGVRTACLVAAGEAMNEDRLLLMERVRISADAAGL